MMLKNPSVTRLMVASAYLCEEGTRFPLELEEQLAQGESGIRFSCSSEFIQLWGMQTCSAAWGEGRACGKTGKTATEPCVCFGRGKKSTDVASCCLTQALEGRWLSVSESSETISSFSHSAASCLQALAKVLAGYAVETRCCIADRLCSVLLADSQIHVKPPSVWA